MYMYNYLFKHVLAGELQPTCKYMLYTTNSHRCEVYERIVTENEVYIYIHVYTCVHVNVTWYMYIHVCYSMYMYI